MTWTLATQLPCITMSPIKWDYWLRTQPRLLSTNLVFAAARSCGTSQGFQVTRQSFWQEDHPPGARKMGFSLEIALDTVFQWCPSYELSASEERDGKQKEITEDLVQQMSGWLRSRFGLQHLQLTVVSLACSVKHQQNILWGGLQEESKSEKSHSAMKFLSAETSY